MHLTNAKSCAGRWSGADWCHSSASCIGWGCRLLTVVPTRLPNTMKERAELFAKVYLEAKRKGVLGCRHFDELHLDRVVEKDSELKKIIDTCSSPAD